MCMKRLCSLGSAHPFVHPSFCVNLHIYPNCAFTMHILYVHIAPWIYLVIGTKSCSVTGSCWVTIILKILLSFYQFERETRCIERSEGITPGRSFSFTLSENIYQIHDFLKKEKSHHGQQNKIFTALGLDRSWLQGWMYHSPLSHL